MEKMTIEALTDVVTRAAVGLAEQSAMCDRVDSWMRPRLESGFDLPRHATREHRALRELARTPWLGLVVTTAAQALRVSGFVGASEEAATEAWQMWADNRILSTQTTAHRGALSYGFAFGVATPATKADGSPSARIRFRSPRRMWADFGDDIGAPYPLCAVEHVGAADSATYRVYDAGFIYDVVKEREEVRLVSDTPHRAGVCPVTRFENLPDLEGGTVGEVEPLIPTAQRINKTAYDRLLAQHFSSWRVRTATGIDLPEAEDGSVDSEATAQLKMKLAQDDLLIAEDAAARFGTLEATDLKPFVDAWRSDIEALAAVSQTPAHALTGQLVNLSGDALAAARSPLTQKVSERQATFGDAHSRLIRAALAQMGSPHAADSHLRTTWADLEIRSMSQAVDALGKAAVMLGIPKRALWPRIPGVERGEIESWEELADREAAADPFGAMLRRHGAEQDVSTEHPDTQEA